MSSLLPVAVYGLKVPAGDVMIPATVDFPATFRLTMAAIDPTAAPQQTGTTKIEGKPRATLKIVYNPSGPGNQGGSEDSDEVDAALQALLQRRINDEDDEDEEDDEEDEDDDDESSDDEDVNGGPSDPSKSKKARKEAAAQQLIEALAQLPAESDEDMDVDDDVPKTNGVSKKEAKTKGKGKVVERPDISDYESKDEEDDEGDKGDDDTPDDMSELVICSLDPEQNYQQTLDLTVPEDQDAYFKVSGTHAVYLTGNYVVPNDNSPMPDIYGDEDDSDDYDLEPDEDELEEDEESDELDDLEDPRITEVDSEDEIEAPALVKKDESKKGKNKRPAEDSEEEPASLDDIMAKSLKPEDKPADKEPKLSKKQLKKLKKNDGKAAPTASDAKPPEREEGKEKTDKKVSFAKDLEQPGLPSTKVNGETKSKKKQDSKPDGPKVGVKFVQGVKIDDRKLGTGPAAKKGDKVGMRYIGKLSNGKVFDANKKGPALRFKIGDGSVIKGWDIAVAGMTVGGERRAVIPANLAYGSKKMPDIPANSELTFDLKLLEIM